LLYRTFLILRSLTIKNSADDYSRVDKRVETRLTQENATIYFKTSLWGKH
jgi:hypothetical protein